MRSVGAELGGVGTTQILCAQISVFLIDSVVSNHYGVCEMGEHVKRYVSLRGTGASGRLWLLFLNYSSR